LNPTRFEFEDARPQLDQLDASIPVCLLRDRFPLASRIRRLRESRHQPDFERQLAVLAEQVAQSVSARAWRVHNVPRAVVDDSLPIAAHADEIIASIQRRQVVVVAGQTGSGKSTQLPKLCLAAGYGRAGMIGHTQPRRIAARTIAARLAQEMRVELGRQVGFKIRFTDASSDQTFVKVMTDGILLAETRSDRFLEQYEVIILDEAHERSLNVDFLIGYMHRLIRRRGDLRVIITSATLDAVRFAEHFGDTLGPAPVITVAGRTFPVEVRYRPPVAEDGEDDPNIADAIVAAIRELSAADPGDILVFLPTERDILDIAKRLRAEVQNGELASSRHGGPATLILPLYARLSTQEQNRIFEMGPSRRIVLATNVAESSLTVPGIRHVIDTGTARISRYSPRLKVQRLPIEAISRASADQRRGRCGRIAPGICIRLYAEDDYQSRDEFTTPEIRRTNLAAVILQAELLKLGLVDQIPFLEPPRADAIRDGYKTLFELGAVDSDHQLTKLGVRLGKLPVDPRIGRMILAAEQEGCLSEVLIIAAALEVQDPRERPPEKQQAADAAHAAFQDEGSDFIAFLKLWDFYHHLKESTSRNKLRKACQKNFLSWNRLHEWQEIHRQLLDIVRDSGMKLSKRRDPREGIHIAILSGLLSGVALKTAESEYTGAGGVKFRLWPGSGLFQKRPTWIMAAEIVETSQRYARTAAEINPEWIESLASHLVKRSYSDPHWHAKSETVMAFEKLSLFGLPVVEQRRTRYGTIDPVAARKLFIQHGLVEGQLRSSFPFLEANRDLLRQLEEMAARTRDRQLIVDEYTLFAQYQRRIPEGIFDVAGLRRWLKPAFAKRNALLTFSRDDFVQTDLPDWRSSFPDHVTIGSVNAPAEYVFRPGDAMDGLTITVPVEALNQVTAAGSGWLVPGLVEPQLLALIRSLPKPVRRNFVSVSDLARRIAGELPFHEGDFVTQVAARLSKLTATHISVDDFRLDQVPEHLKMNIRVVDADGAVLATGRDVMALRAEVGQQVPTISEIHDDRWSRDGVTVWDFGDIPEEIVMRRGEARLPMYPAIVAAGDYVRLRLVNSPEAARYETRRGVARLFSIRNRKSLRSQTHWLPDWQRLKVLTAGILDAASLDTQVPELIALIAIDQLPTFPTSQTAFEACLSRSGELIAVATQEVAAFLRCWKGCTRLDCRWNVSRAPNGRCPAPMSNASSMNCSPTNSP
jgi:ATP-dependent helicase HrpA